MSRTWGHEIHALTIEQRDGKCAHCAAAAVFTARWGQSVRGRSSGTLRRLCLIHGRMFADRHGLVLPPVQLALDGAA